MTKKISFRKKLSLSIFKKYKNVQAKLHELSYLFWECTLRCNIACQHCGSDCKSDNKIVDMPAADFLAVTSKIATQYNPNKVMVVITGGEPLIRKDLEEVGVGLHRQGYPWGFVTNGYLLDSLRLERLMQAGLSSITISLDGFEEDHNWLRGRNDSYYKALNAIKLVIAQKNLVYDVVTCVNKRNFKDLSKLRDFFIQIGVKKWRIFMIDPIGRAIQNNELFIDKAQFNELMQFIKNCNHEGIIRTSFGCDGFLGSFENEAREGFFFCRAGINIASVLVDGSISVCPNNSKYFIQGNIYNDDFWEVWNNKFLPMRNRSWTKKGICENCKEYKFCEGSGLHLHCNQTDDVLICHYNLLD